jgi:hypothetical protein
VEADGGKHLHLPVQGLEEHGFLFGPTKAAGTAVEARVRVERLKRQYPLLGVGLNGQEGPRLKLITATGRLELSINGEKLVDAPCAWQSGQWCWLRLQSITQADGSLRIEGKAWMADTKEPENWMVRHTLAPERAADLDAGRASVWAAPFSKTEAAIDDIRVLPAAP